MRLRTFTAPSMAAAMRQVRAALGPDAILLASEEDSAGVRVTAAVEPPEPALPKFAPDALDPLNEALSRHGVAPALAQRILHAALPRAAADPLAALSTALATVLTFAPISVVPGQPLMLVGPPGAGKTVTIAKLAARAVMAGTPVRLVTTDTVRAGGIEQLESLARVLRAPLRRADGAARLALALGAEASGRFVLIDSPGANPFRSGDRQALAALIAASGAEPVLVLPAGGDAVDLRETARLFRALGCRRLIATRLDLACRLGSLIGTADAMALSLAEAGTSPDIAGGLAAFSPAVLAARLLPEPGSQAKAVGAVP